MKLMMDLSVSLLIAMAGCLSLFWGYESKSDEIVEVTYQVTAASVTEVAKLDPVAFSLETTPESLALRLTAAFGLNETRAKNFATWIIEVRDRHGIPPVILSAIISAESSFRYKAVSSYGAVGPTQVVPRFWASQCEGDITNDPRANVLCAGKVLTRYFERCEGDVSCALAAYNVGPRYIKEASRAMDQAMISYWTKISRAVTQFDPNLKPNLSHTWREALLPLKTT